MSVARCPQCKEEVSVPQQTPPEARVRCPLCSEEYLLSAALATLPPLLEVIELPEGYSELSPFVPEQKYVPRDHDDGDGSSFGLQPADEVPEPTPEPRHEVHEFALQGDDDAAVLTEEAPEISDASPRSSLGPAAVKRQQLTPSVPSRRKKHASNPIVEMVKVVLGGVVAVPLTILILLWLPGKWRRDPFQVGPKIASYTPWLVPADMRPPAAPTATLDPRGKSAAIPLEKPTPPKDPIPSPPETKTAVLPTVKPIEGEKELFPTEDTTPEPKPPVEPPIVPVSVPKVETVPEPEPKPEPKPEPVPEPKPAVEPEPSASSAKEKLTQANEAFDAAITGTDRKAIVAAAKGLYQAAAELAAGQVAAEDFATLTADPKKLQQIVGNGTAVWLDNAERGSDGIVVYGNVKSCVAAGDKFEVVIELPKQREVIVIIDAPQNAGESIFVAGKIVANAKEMVPGYQGEATQAVAGKVVTANKPAAAE